MTSVVGVSPTITRRYFNPIAIRQSEMLSSNASPAVESLQSQIWKSYNRHRNGATNLRICGIKEDFQAAIKQAEREYGTMRGVELENGEITFKECPTVPHEVTSAGINEELAFLARPWRHVLRFFVSSRIRTGDDACKEPDQAWGPRRRDGGKRTDGRNNPYPTVVLEVGLSETWAAMKKKAEDHWLNGHTSILLWIGVAISEKDKSIIFAIWKRESPMSEETCVL